MHPDWTDSLNRSETVKARWSEEEVSLLARREAELSMKGARFINQELLSYIPGRTLESIKGVRKRGDYRALVIEDVARTELEAEVSPIVGAQAAGEDEECDRYLLVYFRSLEPPDTDAFAASWLHDICCLVGKEDRGDTLEMLIAYLLDIFPVPRNAGPANLQWREAVPALAPLSRRKQRRVDYGRAQKLWRRNSRRCYNAVIIQRLWFPIGSPS